MAPEVNAKRYLAVCMEKHFKIGRGCQAIRRTYRDWKGKPHKKYKNEYSLALSAPADPESDAVKSPELFPVAAVCAAKVPPYIRSSFRREQPDKDSVRKSDGPLDCRKDLPGNNVRHSGLDTIPMRYRACRKDRIDWAWSTLLVTVCF